MRSLLVVCLLSSVALAEPKVTSKTTDLYPSKKCTEKMKGGDGEDPVLSCPAAMKGYDVTVSFSAETAQVTVTGDGKTTSFSGHLGKTLEWRLVDGKPVTLLVENGDTDPDHLGELINRRISIYEVGIDQPKSEAIIDKKTPVAKAWAAARVVAGLRSGTSRPRRCSSARRAHRRRPQGRREVPVAGHRLGNFPRRSRRLPASPSACRALPPRSGTLTTQKPSLTRQESCLTIEGASFPTSKSR